MMTRIAKTLLLALAAGAVAGCSLYGSRLDETFGYAQAENTSRMIAHPEGAGQAEGLDPATAEQVTENHRTRQAETEAREVPSIVNIDTGF